MRTHHLRVDAERAIAHRLVTDLLAAGYFISINNGGDENEIETSRGAEAVLKAMFASDEDWIIVLKQTGSRDHFRVGWIRLVYGNSGHDAISDYTSNLETICAGAEELAKEFEAQMEKLDG